eukprot:1081894-Pleurochrysis_carterae.AAC.1
MVLRYWQGYPFAMVKEHAAVHRIDYERVRPYMHNGSLKVRGVHVSAGVLLHQRRERTVRLVIFVSCSPLQISNVRLRVLVRLARLPDLFLAMGTRPRSVALETPVMC